MSEPFLGEIKLMSFSFVPRGWASCDGQLLPIAQNQALFALLGTTYGGNGQTTFALPDLRGRVPMHLNSNSGQQLGDSNGVENYTLTSGEVPLHNHYPIASLNLANSNNPSGGVWATTSVSSYHSSPDSTTMITGILTPFAVAGGTLPHANMQPYTVLNFCIAIVGIFPSRN
jgi:microcystin-dependent protein